MKTLIAATLVATASVTTFGADQQAPLALETVGRIVRLLEDSGYPYSKLPPNVWAITFKGEHNPSIPVLVISDDAQLVIESVVAQHADVSDQTGFMRRLLTLNGTVRGAVFFLDDDGDYVARVQFVLSDLTPAKFKSAIESVAVATDEAYAAVKQFANESVQKSNLNGDEFHTPASSTKMIELLDGAAAVFCDPGKWRETKSEPGRRTFEHVKGDAYAIIITERIQVPLDQLSKIAVANAHQASADITVVEEEHRIVNGTRVLMLRLDGR